MRYLLIFFWFLISLAGFAQNAKIDSLKKVIETTKVDTVKGRSLCRLCRELSNAGMDDVALQKAKEGLSLTEQQNDLQGTAICCTRIGKVYVNQANYSDAMIYFKRSLAIHTQLGDLRNQAQNWGSIGSVYDYQGNYSKALECYQKCLRLSEKIKDQQSIAYTLNNIGILYDIQRNYSKALEYYEKSLHIKEQLKDSIGVGNSLLNIGHIYSNMKDYERAFASIQKSLLIRERLGDQAGVAICLQGIGNIYMAKREYLNTLDYLQKCLPIAEKSGNPYTISAVYIDLGSTYFFLKQSQKAKEYLNKGLKIAQENAYLEWMVNSTKTLIQVDSALGDYKSAFEHHKLYKQYSDSLHNEDKAKEFGRVESKYQFEKEAEEAKRKETETAKIEAEKKQRRDNLQYLTIFAGIIGLFAGLVFIGKFRIPTRVMDVAVFAGLLITFEFLLILFDPLFDQYSGGIPFYKLGFNTVVAFAFAPLHGFLEDKLKRRLVKTK